MMLMMRNTTSVRHMVLYDLRCVTLLVLVLVLVAGVLLLLHYCDTWLLQLRNTPFAYWPSLYYVIYYWTSVCQWLLSGKVNNGPVLGGSFRTLTGYSCAMCEAECKLKHTRPLATPLTPQELLALNI